MKIITLVENCVQKRGLLAEHGHYDHTGGLSSLLKINKKAQVIVKKGALTPFDRRLPLHLH